MISSKVLLIVKKAFKSTLRFLQLVFHIEGGQGSSRMTSFLQAVQIMKGSCVVIFINAWMCKCPVLTISGFFANFTEEIIYQILRRNIHLYASSGSAIVWKKCCSLFFQDFLILMYIFFLWYWVHYFCFRTWRCGDNVHLIE